MHPATASVKVKTRWPTTTHHCILCGCENVKDMSLSLNKSVLIWSWHWQWTTSHIMRVICFFFVVKWQHYTTRDVKFANDLNHLNSSIKQTIETKLHGSKKLFLDLFYIFILISFFKISSLNTETNPSIFSWKKGRAVEYSSSVRIWQGVFLFIKHMVLPRWCDDLTMYAIRDDIYPYVIT